MKKIVFLFLSIFSFFMVAEAKEINIYFNPNGGKVVEEDFDYKSYSFIRYQDISFAGYSGNKTIKHINSISSKTFTMKKDNTSLVSGREWYFTYDDQIYYFSEAKQYQVNDIFQQLSLEDDNFISIDLYANWKDHPKNGGKDIKTAGTNTNKENEEKSISFDKEKITLKVHKNKTLTVKNGNTNLNNNKVSWTSSKPKVASVDKKGNVKALSVGSTTITAKYGKQKATVTITVKGNVDVGDATLKHALKFCEEGNVDANGNCKDGKLTYKLSHGVQSIASTSDGEYLFFLSPNFQATTTNNYGDAPLVLRIFKKHAQGYYYFFKKDTDVPAGHANGATYYQANSGKNLLIATSIREGDGPQLVRYRLYLNPEIPTAGDVKNSYTKIRYYRNADRQGVNQDNVLENDSQTVIGVSAKTGEDDALKGIYLSVTQPSHSDPDVKTFRMISYYDTTKTFEAGPSSIFRRYNFNSQPSNDPYNGVFYHNQDITYYNNRMYAVYYDEGEGCPASFTKNFNMENCPARTNYITVFDQNGSILKIRKITESAVSSKIQSLDPANYSSDVTKRIKEAQTVFFLNGKAYVAIQKSRSDIIGTYIFRVYNVK